MTKSKHLRAIAWMADDDEEMQRFVTIEGLFKGRHFDRLTDLSVGLNLHQSRIRTRAGIERK